MPLGFILYISRQHFCPTRRKICNDTRPISLAQFRRESLGMRIAAKLNLALGLHDPRHGSQGAHQPVVLRDGFLGNGVLNRLCCPVIEPLQLVGRALPLIWVAQIQPGRMIYEIEGVDETTAREAFRLAAAKLSVTTTFVTRTVR